MCIWDRMFQRGWRDYRSHPLIWGWGDVMKPIVVSCIVLVALTTVTAGQTKYKVTATVANDVDFDQLMTYSWTMENRRSTRSSMRGLLQRLIASWQPRDS